MKKATTLFVSSLIISGVLVACNSGDESDQEQPTTETGDNAEVEDNDAVEDDQEDTDVDNGDDGDLNEDVDDDENNGSDDGVLAEGEFEDQLELEIGDTGTIDTLIGSFAVTVNDVEILEDIDGEMSQLDYFMLVNYTVQNIGDEDLDAREAIDSMESTHRLEGSGYSDNAEYYDQFEAIEGTLAPNEEVTGEAIYSAYEGEEYFLRVTEGLVGSGAAKNQIRFTFQKSEIE